ncbi:zinc finger BED domain-containing protein RICESLEEPER 2-like [Nicotiana tomentosiformis]|uniref:zinc finger BED domain-containing protein RICESLEEPER 2-like n=1 Tax=Nicotiana tomentosiformis TaxID=4098 RepID=UPI00388C5F52
MMGKFDKYWSFNSKTNYLLFVAIVLDPRFKLEYVEFCFGEIYGHDNIVIKSRIASVIECLDELYHEYKRLYTFEQEKFEDLTSNKVFHGMDTDECDKSLDFLDSQFAKRIESQKKTKNASEVAKYLNDELIGKKIEFDLLAWWKGNKTKFSVLSRLAKDVLSIPVSTVSSEQVFSTSGHVIDSFRSSITPKTVEALICAQNWLRSTPIDLRESLGNIESLEEIEEDYRRSVDVPDGIVAASLPY